MQLTALDRAKLRVLAIVVICSTLGSAVFGILVGNDSIEAAEYSSALIGAYNGCLISLLVARFEIFSGDVGALSWLRRAPFLLNVVLRSVFYLAVFVLVIRSSFVVVGSNQRIGTGVMQTFSAPLRYRSVLASCSTSSPGSTKCSAAAFSRSF